MCTIRTNLHCVVHCVQASITDSLKNPVFRIRIRIGSGFNQFSGSGYGFWIWIRTGSRRAKITNKKRKRYFIFWSAGGSISPVAWTDILYGCLGIGKLQFLIKIISNFFPAVFLFLVIKPWIWIGSGSGSVFILKCWIWIQIRTQWIQIRNTDINHPPHKMARSKDYCSLRPPLA